METIKVILYPIVYLLDFIFIQISNILFDYPLLAIIIFSGLIVLFLRPIQKPLRKIELKTTELINLIENEYALLAKDKNKEEQFFLRDQLYKKYSYNPFQSFKQAISFFVLIPFLISVIIVFDQSIYLQNSYLFGFSLSEPDGILFGYNLLPVIMFLSTYLDSIFRYAKDRFSRNRFLAISVVLFFLVYNLQSALILFWISMNLINMIIFYMKNEI
tara:strand:+ start:51 stop:698 length:648 start_codon:yes stop_codon:yes gene_type:complete